MLKASGNSIWTVYSFVFLSKVIFSGPTESTSYLVSKSVTVTKLSPNSSFNMNPLTITLDSSSCVLLVTHICLLATTRTRMTYYWLLATPIPIWLFLSSNNTLFSSVDSINR
jgi:hypothetical protein